MNNIERCRLWYKENKKEKLEYQRDYNKKTNYANEKTNKERLKRNIKRKTRKLYPLKDQKCAFCNSKATERHHNTIPIKFDEFIFVCHDCHVKTERIVMGYYSK